MNIRNPYKNTEFIGPYFLMRIAVIPILSMQLALFFIFSNDVAGAGVCAIIFLLTFILGEETKLLKCDDDFMQSFFLVYFLTGMYSSLMGWFDLFGGMLILIVIDIFWSVNIYEVYKKVYFEVNQEKFGK
jgi:hypothetical protein